MSRNKTEKGPLFNKQEDLWKTTLKQEMGKGGLFLGEWIENAEGYKNKHVSDWMIL